MIECEGSDIHVSINVWMFAKVLLVFDKILACMVACCFIFRVLIVIHCAHFL